MLVSVAVEGWSDTGMADALVRSCGLEPWRILPADGKTKLDPKIPGYVRAARYDPWIVFRDSDGACPVELRRQLAGDEPHPDQFVLRIACTMSEAWLLGDHEAFSRRFSVSQDTLPPNPEELEHAKRSLLGLLQHSRSRSMREEMVDERNSQAAGVLYVDHLNEFALNHWRPEVAGERCPSLQRAIDALRRLAASSVKTAT